jgi:thiopurine S-methyltransferase
MDAEFRHRRWRDAEIGFHPSTPTPLLRKHWPAVGAPAGGTVFVPVAGKSLGMLSPLVGATPVATR